MIRFENWLRRQSIPEHSNTLRLAHLQLSDLSGIERFRELEYLDCAFNSLELLPDLHGFEKLRILNMSHNRLCQLPSLPRTLIQLDCSCNQLQELPDQLPKLQQFFFASNYIKKAPDLSQMPLRVIDGRGNLLSKIPNHPEWAVALFDENPIEPDSNPDDQDEAAPHDPA